MTTRSHRLAGILLRIFQVLRVLIVVGLVILIPTMIFALAFPADTLADRALRADVVPAQSRTTVAGLMLYANVVLAAAFFIVTKLIGMMRSVTQGSPFTLHNVARLRAIAAAMGTMVVFKLIAALALTAGQRRVFDMQGPNFDVSLFLGMLVVLVLAEVFREGVALREDAEGTV